MVAVLRAWECQAEGDRCALPGLARQDGRQLSSGLMHSLDLDLLRQRLEEQFRADVQILYEGYCAKLRAYEAVFLAEGRLDPARLPALTFGAGGAMPTLQIAQPVGPLAPVVPAVPTAPVAPSGPAPASPSAAAAPAPAPRRRWGPNELRDELLAALEQAGEEFDRADLARVIGGAPARSTLHRLLAEMEGEGRIREVKRAVGRKPARYSRVAAAPAADSKPAG